MSLETWKAEFYPIPASKVKKKHALTHSLKKWEGAMKKNLKRHGVVFDDGAVFERKDGWPECFRFNRTSCSLCWWFDEDMDCSCCPLRILLGSACVCEYGRAQRLYEKGMDGNPLPMIRALRKAMKLQEAKK